MRRMLCVAATSAVLLLLVAPLAGCLQDDIGLRCAVCGDDRCEFDETVESCPDDCNPEPLCGGKPCPRGGDTILDLQALACESRVCIKYLSGSKGPRCTEPCEEDSDCPGSVAGCDKFVCRVGQSVGGVACCKFCVCNNDATTTDKEFQICQTKGQAAKCPNI